MIGRLKQLILLIVFSLTVVVFGVAYAASIDTTPVSVTVYDKSGDVLPFATVSVKGMVKQTGSKGEPVKFDLGKGKYSIQASHPLVKKPNGAIVNGKAKLTLKKDKPSLAISLKIKRDMTVDATNPVVTAIAPNPKQNISTTKPLPLSVHAEDPESQIATVTALLDGKSDMGTPVVSGKTYSWNKVGLLEGDHRIVFTAWNFAGKTSTKAVEFTIVPAVGTLNGVVRQGNALVGGATIKIDNGTHTATTDSKGVYTITGIRIGNRSVAIQAAGLQSQTVATTIEEDKARTVNVTLVDNVAPAVPTGLSVTKGTPSSTIQTVTWNATTDLNGVSYELQRYTGSTLTETKALTTTTFTFSGLTAGETYGYSIRALDKVATPNASAWSTRVTMAAQKLPTLNWVTPTAGQKIKATQTLKTDFAVFGTGNTVKQIDWLLLPSTNLGKTNPTTVTGASTLDWDTKTVANGDYSVKTTITDNEGNSSTSTVSFTVDNPQTSKVNGTVTYNGKAVAGATIKSDENVTSTTNSTGKYEVVINTLGNRTLTVKASGLTDQTKAVNVPTTTVVVADVAMTDGIAPSVPNEVAIVNTKPTASKQTVSWKASTDISGIKEYTVSRFTGTTLVETKIVTGTSVIFTGLEGAKEYGYTVKATDKATTPNVSAATAVVRQTTQTTPVIAWMAPTADQSLTGTVTLQAEYTVYSVGAKKVDWINKTNNVVIGTTVIASLNDEPTQDWDTSAVSNGAKVVQAKITDDEDNFAIAEVAVSVDNIQYGNLTGKVSDFDGTIAGVEATLKKKADGTVIGTLVTDATGSYTFENVETGDYNVTFATEGYTDKTVAKAVKTGANTADVTLSILPRINGFTSTGRTLAIPDDQEVSPGGLSINPNTDELISLNTNSWANIYNAKTEQFIKTYNNPDGATNEFVAFDPLGFMVARFGSGVWLNTSTQETVYGPVLRYYGLVSMQDGSIISADDNKIWRFVNHQKVPQFGYDIRSITGTSSRSGVAATEKSVFVDNVANTLFKLSLTDPTDPTKAFSKQLSYEIGAIHHISGTRTLLIAETATNTLHLLDTRTLDEYATVQGLGPKYPHGNDLASYKNGNTYKLFITSSDDKKIYVNTSN